MPFAVCHLFLKAIAFLITCSDFFFYLFHTLLISAVRLLIFMNRFSLDLLILYEFWIYKHLI